MEKQWFATKRMERKELRFWNLPCKLWGPNDLWARPIYSRGIQRPKPRKAVAQARQDSLWMLPRAVQSSADPKFPLRKKGKNGIGLKLGRKI